MVFCVPIRFSSVRRLRFILSKIFLFAGGILLQRSRLLPLIPWKSKLRTRRARGEEKNDFIRVKDHTYVISAPRLRELLETLGPTFVKLGQILSLRSDFVGQGLSRELSRLQSQAPSFPFEEVVRIIEEEFHLPVHRVFTIIDPVPVAAASLAQVHRAQLPGGADVAVKVQRPGVRKTIEEDIGILRFLARLARRFIPEIRPYQPEKIVEEFADWTGRELDFVTEAHNAERFRFAFRDNQYVRIPIIHWDFTTSRVLTMEFIDGIRADDLQGIDGKGLDRQTLALHGVDAQLQQFLLDGFFHGDPHPGNSFALDGNVLCFYDFGIVGYLSEEQRMELIGCFIAFTERDIEGFLRHFLHLSRFGPHSDRVAFYRDASAILAEVFFSPTSSSLAWIFFRLINKAASRHIYVSADLALFGKALITTEAMGKTLFPEFDFTAQLTPFVVKAFEAYLDPARLRRSLTGNFFDWVGIIQDLPGRLRMGKAIRDKGGDNREGSYEYREDLTDTRRKGYMHLVRIVLLFTGLLFAVAIVTAPSPGAGVSPLACIGIAVFLSLLILFLVLAERS